jgi:hypothetical protein
VNFYAPPAVVFVVFCASIFASLNHSIPYLIFSRTFSRFYVSRLSMSFATCQTNFTSKTPATSSSSARQRPSLYAFNSSAIAHTNPVFYFSGSSVAFARRYREASEFIAYRNVFCSFCSFHILLGSVL